MSKPIALMVIALLAVSLLATAALAADNTLTILKPGYIYKSQSGTISFSKNIGKHYSESPTSDNQKTSLGSSLISLAIGRGDGGRAPSSVTITLRSGDTATVLGHAVRVDRVEESGPTAVLGVDDKVIVESVKGYKDCVNVTDNLCFELLKTSPSNTPNMERWAELRISKV